MIDKTSQFFAILTAVGEAKQANADALGIPWTFSQLGVGDANGTDPIPDRAQTQLIREQRRAPLNLVKVDPKNTNVIIAEQVIPENEGGWWIREIGLYDADGDLVAVANCAPSFKPLLAQGSGKTQVVRMNFIVTSAANITLKIDPSVVLATREYVDNWFANVLPPTRPAGTYTKVEINVRGIVVGGSNPNTLEGYGITDALPLTGGTLTGAINLTDAKSLYIRTVASPTWAAGVIAGQLSGEKAGIGFLGSHETVNRVFMGLGATPWVNGNGIRVSANGVEITGPVSGNGTGLTHLKYSALVGTPNSLAGYGVAFASQNEAETGADTNKPMNALRVFQAIVKKVVQATESALGTAHIATQVQVNAGTDNSAIVTPKKLCWGFQMVMGRTGYIVFPSWLNGWIVQWSGGVTLTGNAINTTRFPIPFPNEVGAVIVGAYNNASPGDYSVRLSDGANGSSGTTITKESFKTFNTGVSWAAGLSYIAVGH